MHDPGNQTRSQSEAVIWGSDPAGTGDFLKYTESELPNKLPIYPAVRETMALQDLLIMFLDSLRRVTLEKKIRKKKERGRELSFPE